MGEDDECWGWDGPLDKDQYSCLRINGDKLLRVRRLVYELYVGDIPDNLYVYSKCWIRECLNFHHMFLDGVGRGRALHDQKRRLLKQQNRKYKPRTTTRKIMDFPEVIVIRTP